MSEKIDIDELRTWIGKQERESDTITPELLKRFRATLSDYTELPGEIPLGIHWCLAPPAVSQDGLGMDGHPAKGGFLPPVPLPHRMWASSRVRFFKTPTLGVPIVRTSTVSDVVLKQSATSGPLAFVTVDHAYTQQTQQIAESLIQDRQTIVYRQASNFNELAPQETTGCAHSLNIVPDSTLLFRYSAVTFNGHRIHYDKLYAHSEEGYPGLVVHGPLMATLLMNLAQAHQPDKTLREFEFRGIAPAFVDQALKLAINDPDTHSLEVTNHKGALIMTASAKFASSDDS